MEWDQGVGSWSGNVEWDHAVGLWSGIGSGIMVWDNELDHGRDQEVETLMGS